MSWSKEISQPEPNRGPLFVRNHEIYHRRLAGVDTDGFLPRLGLRKQGPLYGFSRQHVKRLRLASERPSFMPRNDLIGAGRNIAEFEATVFVGDCVVGMWDDKHFRVHPNVTAVASQSHQPGRRHGARVDLVGKWKRQIVGGSAFHMYGMQRGIGALHRQFGLLRNQQDVRNVAAAALVEMAELFGSAQRFPGRDVLEINDGVGDAALRADDQALKVGGFLGVGIADLRVFRDRKSGQVGNRARPLYSTVYGSPVADADDFIGLGGSKGKQRHAGKDQQPTENVQQDRKG